VRDVRRNASALVGHSFSVLYPSVAEFERIGKRMEPILNASGITPTTA
jgi:hypothetical protein